MVLALEEPSLEEMLLLECCSFDGGDGIGEAIAQNLDWNTLLKVAKIHGVLPLLYRRITASATEAVPDAVFDEIRRGYLLNIQRNFLISKALLGLLDDLVGRGIPALPFKGPVLAQQAYGDLALRQFQDLDVLVPREEIKKARDLLLSKGYREDIQLDGAGEAAFLRYQHHLHLSRPGLSLELHWRIAPVIYSFCLDPSNLWDRASDVKILDRAVRCPSPEDSLLIATEHGTRHYWSRLLWICDVGNLALQDLDWGQVFTLSEDLGTRRALLLGLALARDLLGYSLPSQVTLEVGDPMVESLAEEAMGRIFRENSIGPKKELFYLRARERRRDRARYYLFRATLPTTEELQRFHLPGPLAPLYHVIRPAMILGRYRMDIWRWFR